MAYTNSSLICTTIFSPFYNVRNHVIDTITIHCMAGNLSVENCGALFQRSATKASSNYGIGTDGRIAMYVEEKNRSWCSSNKANDHRAITIEVANDGGSPDWHISDKAMAALIELCADICRRNNIARLIWSTDKSTRVNHLNGANMTVHRDFAAKACPGNYIYSKLGYIADEVNKKLNAPKVNNKIHADKKQTSVSNDTYIAFVKEVQAACGAKVDGIAGPETLSKTITLSRKWNCKHAAVKAVQKYLNAIGYDCGDVDGIFGVKTEQAVRKFQNANRCIADGEITFRQLTWKKLLKLA